MSHEMLMTDPEDLTAEPLAGYGIAAIDTDGRLYVKLDEDTFLYPDELPGKALFTPKWNGSVGTRYGNGANVSPEVGEVVMIDVGTGEEADVNLPAVAAGNAGKVVGFALNKRSGNGIVNVNPNGLNTINGDNSTLSTLDNGDWSMLLFMSDGSGGWVQLCQLGASTPIP